MFLDLDENLECRSLLQYTDPRPKHLQHTISSLLPRPLNNIEEADALYERYLREACRPGNGPVLLYFPCFEDGYHAHRIIAEDTLSLKCFTSPLKARLFAKSLRTLEGFSHEFKIQYATAFLLQLRMREILPELDVHYFELDPFPYQKKLEPIHIEDVLSAGILENWAVTKTYNDLINESLLALTREEFRRGRVIEARDVALEIVQNVEAEQPEVHYLLGKCAIELNDSKMLQEAKENLRFLNFELTLELLEAAREESHV